MITAEVIEQVYHDIIEKYGELPGNHAVGVFPTDDDPPLWVNVSTTRPVVNMIAFQLGFVIEDVEKFDGEQWVKAP